MDEEYLVRRSKEGDKNAFAALIELYQDRLYRTAWCVLGNSQDAYDALQECVLKTYMALDSLKNNYYFKYWINKILINSCNDILRKRKKVISIDDTGDLAASDVYDVRTLDLKAAMKKLDRKYRDIIGLRYYQDLPYEDIAEILGCPVGTVKSRLNYALKKLRETMNEEGMMEVGQ